MSDDKGRGHEPAPSCDAAIRSLLHDEIRAKRRAGELLGPLCVEYGADNVVAALGAGVIARALGVRDEWRS